MIPAHLFAAAVAQGEPTRGRRGSHREQRSVGTHVAKQKAQHEGCCASNFVPAPSGRRGASWGCCIARTQPDAPLDGHRRVYVDDPLGNRIELIN